MTGGAGDSSLRKTALMISTVPFDIAASPTVQSLPNRQRNAIPLVDKQGSLAPPDRLAIVSIVLVRRSGSHDSLRSKNDTGGNDMALTRRGFGLGLTAGALARPALAAAATPLKIGYLAALTGP